MLRESRKTIRQIRSRMHLVQISLQGAGDDAAIWFWILQEALYPSHFQSILFASLIIYRLDAC